jgi:FtsZ-binding cell division protein ZapB
MAVAKRALEKGTEELRGEHAEMLSRLADLDRALESLVCFADFYADLSAVAPAQELAFWLAPRLAEHFASEEHGILAQIGQKGPEAATFTREMKRQHQEIREHLEAFLRAANAFQTAADLQQSISDLKEEGKALSSFMAAHMGAEEREYAALK